MVVIRAQEARGLEEKVAHDRLSELRRELNSERGLVKSGGRAQNPGRIRELRRTIARVLTIVHEKELGIARKMRERKKKGAKQAAAPAKQEAPAKAEQKDEDIAKKEKEPRGESGGTSN